MASETTAAAEGAVGKVRRDPMAILPFCGYYMADYFRDWIKMQRGLSVTPRIFHLNFELVPQRRKRELSLAEFRREPAHPEVDRPGSVLQRPRLERPVFSARVLRKPAFDRDSLEFEEDGFGISLHVNVPGQHARLICQWA